MAGRKERTRDPRKEASLKGVENAGYPFKVSVIGAFRLRGSRAHPRCKCCMPRDRGLRILFADYVRHIVELRVKRARATNGKPDGKQCDIRLIHCILHQHGKLRILLRERHAYPCLDREQLFGKAHHMAEYPEHDKRDKHIPHARDKIHQPAVFLRHKRDWRSPPAFFYLGRIRRRGERVHELLELRIGNRLDIWTKQNNSYIFNL